MPSTAVHVAFALVVAACVLGDAYDTRAVLAVAGAAVVPDLDVFAPFLLANTHRALLHTFLVPLGLAAAIYYDTRVRDRSWLRERAESWGVQVAWAATAGYAVAGIGLDLFTGYGGVNVLYPLHDQFYSFTGKALYSTDGGFVQTFVEVTGDESGTNRNVNVNVGESKGSTEGHHVASGVDPSAGPEEQGVKRVFPVAYRGWHMVLLLTGLFVTAVRLRFGGFGPVGGADSPGDAEP